MRERRLKRHYTKEKTQMKTTTATRNTKPCNMFNWKKNRFSNVNVYILFIESYGVNHAITCRQCTLGACRNYFKNPSFKITHSATATPLYSSARITPKKNYSHSKQLWSIKSARFHIQPVSLASSFVPHIPHYILSLAVTCRYRDNVSEQKEKLQYRPVERHDND